MNGLQPLAATSLEPEFIDCIEKLRVQSALFLTSTNLGPGTHEFKSTDVWCRSGWSGGVDCACLAGDWK
jgi:hypothetical protein